MHFRSCITLVAMLFSASHAEAHDYMIGKLHIDQPYARATVPYQTAGAAYLTIENNGKTSDRLLALASPIAKSVEIHTMSMDGNIMKMREVPAIEIAPFAKIMMQPGNGYHIMLTGLKQPLKAGSKFPLTLTFEKAGKINLAVMIQDTDQEPKAAKAHQPH